MNLKNAQRGSALVIVLVVMVAAAGLSAIMYQTTQRNTQNTLDHALSTNKLFAAESALEAARWAVRKVCESGTAPVDITNDLYEVKFTETAVGSKIYKVAATAYTNIKDLDGSGSVRRIGRKLGVSGIECKPDPAPTPTWQAAITACEWVTMGGSSSTFSYSSSDKEESTDSLAGIVVLNDGGYLTKTGSGSINGDIVLPGSGAYVEFSGSAKMKGDVWITGARGSRGDFKNSGSGKVTGNVHTSGNLTLSGSAEITGNVYVGGTVSKSGSAKIDGATYPNNSPSTTAGVCDPFDVDNLIEKARPPASSNSGNFSQTGSRDLTWTPGTYYYNSFSLSGSGDLNLPMANGNGEYILFVDGPFQMSGSGKLKLANGVSLTVYHTGGSDHSGVFKISGSGSVNLKDNYGQVSIYSNSTGAFTVSGSGGLAATIYAPRTSVDLAGSGDLIGASHSKTFQISGSGHVYYDRSLIEHGCHGKNDRHGRSGGKSTSRHGCHSHRGHHGHHGHHGGHDCDGAKCSSNNGNDDHGDHGDQDDDSDHDHHGHRGHHSHDNHHGDYDDNGGNSGGGDSSTGITVISDGWSEQFTK